MAPFSPLKVSRALCTTMARRHHCLASCRLLSGSGNSGMSKL